MFIFQIFKFYHYYYEVFSVNFFNKHIKKTALLCFCQAAVLTRPTIPQTAILKRNQ